MLNGFVKMIVVGKGVSCNLITMITHFHHHDNNMILNIRMRQALQWRHNECDGVSNHQRLDCLLKRLFRRRSRKTSTLRVTGLCERSSPVIGEFSAHRASNAENVSIQWRHQGLPWNLLQIRFMFFGAISCPVLTIAKLLYPWCLAQFFAIIKDYWDWVLNGSVWVNI